MCASRAPRSKKSERISHSCLLACARVCVYVSAAGIIKAGARGRWSVGVGGGGSERRETAWAGEIQEERRKGDAAKERARE